mgnify:CR=1 FL=1
MAETQTKRTVFYAPFNREMVLYANDLQAEERYPDGRLKMPPKSIQFVNNFYQTSDKKEIDWLKNHSEFKNGRISIIAEDAMSDILGHQAKKYGMSEEQLKDELNLKNAQNVTAGY